MLHVYLFYTLSSVLPYISINCGSKCYPMVPQGLTPQDKDGWLENPRTCHDAWRFRAWPLFITDCSRHIWSCTAPSIGRKASATWQWCPQPEPRWETANKTQHALKKGGAQYFSKLVYNQVKYGLWMFMVYKLQPKFTVMESSIRDIFIFLKFELGLGKR